MGNSPVWKTVVAGKTGPDFKRVLIARIEIVSKTDALGVV
jgi:hypothetical protein